MLNTTLSKKKRGRPPKMPIDDNEQIRQELRLQISSIVNHDVMIEDMIKDERPILSRKRCPLSELQLDLTEWDEQNHHLKDLLDKYEKIPSPSKVTEYVQKKFQFNFQLNIDSFITNETEEEDSIECTSNISDDGLNPQRGTRLAFMQNKPAINSFCKDGLDMLPEKAKKILEENKDKIFNSTILYQQQIELVINLIFNPDRTSGTGQTAIGKLFGITRGAIDSHLRRMKKERNSLVGRPPLLKDHDMQMIINFVNQCYEDHASPNFYTLIDMIYNKSNILFSYNTLYKIVQESKLMKTVMAPVFESSRAEVELSVILEYYESLNSLFTSLNVPPAFVFNVDESGFIDYIDMHDEIVIVPFNAPPGTVKSAERNSKRSTMIGTISIDGTKLKPYIVLTNKTCEKELIINGYGDSNVLKVYQENGFITSESFGHWADSIFFPELMKRRQETGYKDTAVLLLDGCLAHCSDYFYDQCTYYDVYPFFEPAGSSDQVQALDLGIFGIQKKLKTKIKTSSSFGPSAKQVQQIVNSGKR